MPPLAPIEAPRLFRRIADTLAAAIDAGEFAPGDKLPGERQLAQKLGVSRSSLREALSALELEGRLEIRVGAGVYVRARGGRRSPGLASASRSTPFDVFRARELVEAETAALAARHATDAQLRMIEEAFHKLASEMRADRPHSDGDRLFHVRIAQASGNTALAQIVENLWTDQRTPLSSRMETLFVTGRRRRDNIGEHQRILDAIRARDPVAARRAMREHLRNAQRQRLGSPGALP